jgi:clan AA aspartic protease
LHDEKEWTFPQRDWTFLFDALSGADYTRIARLLMGLTHIKVNIANPARPGRALELSFLVDSGAVYSVVPAALLRKLGVRPHSKRTFIFADGSEITRKIGDVLFRLNGRQGAAPVIFGEKQDSVLLGTLSLEALGMMLDPMKRELRPLPMLLASHTL